MIGEETLLVFVCQLGYFKVFVVRKGGAETGTGVEITYM